MTTTATFSYSGIIGSASRTTMSTYQTDVLRIMHDINAQQFTAQDVMATVNEARRKICSDTGCLRALDTIVLATNQESYQYGTIPAVFVGNGGSGYTNPTITFSGGNPLVNATATVQYSGGVITGITMTNVGSGFDPTVANPIVMTLTDPSGVGASLTFGCISANCLALLGFNVIYTQERWTLDWAPWSDFSVRWRYWTNWQQRPAIWSQYGQSGFYIAPLPDLNYISEVDTLIIPDDLMDYTTTDPIALIYQAPIKWYAAYLLKQKEQSFNDANWFLQQYHQRLMEIFNETTPRLIPSHYQDNGRWQ